MLGGYTVENKLAPGFVMAHFYLSVIILIPAVALAWRATYETGSRPRATDRTVVWAVRGLGPLAALTLFAGTIATASGPHSGAAIGQHVKRLHFDGASTLSFAVHMHATVALIFALAVVGVWLLKRNRLGAPGIRDPLTVLGLLVAAQGVVGAVQYELAIPSELVAVHVALATATWVAALWAIAREGRLAPAAVRAERLHARPRTATS